MESEEVEQNITSKQCGCLSKSLYSCLLLLTNSCPPVFQWHYTTRLNQTRPCLLSEGILGYKGSLRLTRDMVTVVDTATVQRLLAPAEEVNALMTQSQSLSEDGIFL